MDPLVLEARKTALILIDLQNFLVPVPLAPHSFQELEQRSRSVAQALRSKGGLVVYVRVDLADMLELAVDAAHKNPMAEPPLAGASEITAGAGIESGDLLITKRHWGAFANTELEDRLRQHGIDTVLLGGIATRFGVDSTARQGVDLGFAFIFLEDATSDLDAAAHRMVFESVFPRLGRVRKTHEVIAALA